MAQTHGPRPQQSRLPERPSSNPNNKDRLAAPQTSEEAKEEAAKEEATSSSDDSSSESASSSDDEDPEDVDTIPAPAQKPDFSAKIAAAGAPSLEDRLKAFLPQMAEANSRLGEEGGGKSMEEVGEGEPCIEMSLGLGVLEERGEGEDGDESESDEGESEPHGNEKGQERRSKEKDVMGKLMGGRDSHAGGIEEVG